MSSKFFQSLSLSSKLSKSTTKSSSKSSNTSSIVSLSPLLKHKASPRFIKKPLRFVEEPVESNSLTMLSKPRADDIKISNSKQKVDWALIKFKDNEYLAVATNNIQKYDKEDILVLNDIYSVKVNNEFLKGKLISLGSEDKIQKQLESITSYPSVSINKEISKKKSEKSISMINNDEHELLKMKYEKMISELKKAQKERDEARDELNKLNEKHIELKNSTDELHRSKLLNLGKIILAHWGEQDDLDDLVIRNDDSIKKADRLIVICSKYPEYTMPFGLKMAIEDESRNREKTDKQLIRNILGNLFPDDNFWTENNAKAILAEHSNLMNACLGFLKRLRPTIDLKKIRNVLTSLHGESLNNMRKVNKSQEKNDEEQMDEEKKNRNIYGDEDEIEKSDDEDLVEIEINKKFYQDENEEESDEDKN